MNKVIIYRIDAPNQKENFCEGCIFNGYKGCGLAIRIKLNCFEKDKHYIWIEKQNQLLKEN